MCLHSISDDPEDSKECGYLCVTALGTAVEVFVVDAVGWWGLPAVALDIDL
jgi:hypothetical protein